LNENNFFFRRKIILVTQIIILIRKLCPNKSHLKKETQTIKATKPYTLTSEGTMNMIEFWEKLLKLKRFELDIFSSLEPG